MAHMDRMPAIPEPGVAVLPQYISSTTQKVILKGSSWSKSMTATNTDGQLLFRIQGESFSRSHRKTVVDARINSTLYRVQTQGLSHYYAEVPENGPHLFETLSRNSQTQQTMTIATFTNQADINRPIITLECIPASRGRAGSFRLQGRTVVDVEQIGINVGGEYELTIAPGLDLALVIGIMVAMIDGTKTHRNSFANAGTTGAAGAAPAVM